MAMSLPLLVDALGPQHLGHGVLLSDRAIGHRAHHKEQPLLLGDPPGGQVDFRGHHEGKQQLVLQGGVGKMMVGVGLGKVRGGGGVGRGLGEGLGWVRGV